MTSSEINQKFNKIKLALLSHAEGLAKSSAPGQLSEAARLLEKVSNLPNAPEPSPVEALQADVAEILRATRAIEKSSAEFVHLVQSPVAPHHLVEIVIKTPEKGLHLYACDDGAFHSDPNWKPAQRVTLVPLDPNQSDHPAMLFECKDGAYRLDPDWSPPAATPAVNLHTWDLAPPPEKLDLYESKDGTWHRDSASAILPVQKDAEIAKLTSELDHLRKRFEHFREAMNFIAGNRYGVAARDALSLDAAYEVDPKTDLTFVPPPARKAKEAVQSTASTHDVGEVLVEAVSPTPASPPQPINFPKGCHTLWGVAPDTLPASGAPVMDGDAVEFEDPSAAGLTSYVRVCWSGLLLPGGINVAPVSVDTKVSRFLSPGMRVILKANGARCSLVKLPEQTDTAAPSSGLTFGASS